MPHEIMMDGRKVGTIDPNTGKYNFDDDAINIRVSEIIAGQSGGQPFEQAFSNIRVVYKWDRSRAANNDALFAMWKQNPIVASRIRILNSMIFGRGFKWTYEDTAQAVVDRFWRVNKLKKRLKSLGADTQLFGETFIALVPQKSGDVLVTIYESNSVVIDQNPASVDDVNFYGVAYRDEENSSDEYLKFLPLEKYLMEYEMQQNITSGVVKKVRKALGLGKVKLSGFDGVMLHIKINNSSAEPHGTSDFRQSYGFISDYTNLIDDRLNIHNRYGSPSFDISIDDDDPEIIKNRISELASFRMGDNPVHNSMEEWKVLEWTGSTPDVEHDAREMRGMVCAGTSMPEHILFSQGEGSQENTYALNKLAEDRQDDYGEAFTDVHKFVAIVGGVDPALIDDGSVIFPEISTMSEKAKAETSTLLVGAQVVSRETISYNLGYNWKEELPRIMAEEAAIGDPKDNSTINGSITGRNNSRLNSGQEDAHTENSDNPAASNNITNNTMQGSGRKQERSDE